MIVITMFLFTTDKNNEEEIFDLLINFSTFFVIFHIDNMLIGFCDISGCDLELEWKKDNVKEKFYRYYKFKRKLENIPYMHALINTVDKMMSILFFICFFTKLFMIIGICLCIGFPYYYPFP